MSIRWSYALNQWNNGMERFVRRVEHERAFKTVSASGFEGVEIPAGSGRWEPLGRKDMIEAHFGSVANLRALLGECGIAAVSSYYYDPGMITFEEDSFGRSALNVNDHAGILASITQYAELLAEFGGDCLVVRPLPSFWKAGPVTPEALEAASACWNAVGAMTARHGVRTVLNVDCTSMLRTSGDIAALLERCDPDTVGLSIDTADAVIAGLDPVALYEEFHARVWHVQFKDARHTDTLDEFKLPHAEHRMLVGGGERGIDRWFWEMGTEGGLVDFAGLYEKMLAHGYSGWIVVESDQSPSPPSSTMLNGWYVQRKLLHATA
jgi:inosose dehydratase